MQFCAIIILSFIAIVHSKILLLGCNDIRKFVNGHNQRRLDVAKGKVPGQPGASKMLYMVWDTELADKAASWASKLQYEQNPKKNIDSRRFATGENLYWFSTTDSTRNLTVGKALDAWFNEHKNYTFRPFEHRAPGSPKTGHYIQMVWADTNHVGCAMSKWKDGKWTRYFVVCNYGPSGNYINKTPYTSSSQGSQKLICTVGKNKCKSPFGDRCPRK